MVWCRWGVFVLLVFLAVYFNNLNLYANLCSSIDEPDITAAEIDAGIYSDRLILRFKKARRPDDQGRVQDPNLQARIYTDALRSFKPAAQTEAESSLNDFYVLKLREKNFDTLRNLKENLELFNNSIDSVEWDPIVRNSDYKPNDVLIEGQWAIPKIDMYGAWDLLNWYDAAENSFEARRPVVAIIDSGLNKKHIDLQGKILQGWDFYSDDDDPNDDMGHGTHVAGIIAANTNNREGVASIAPNVWILPIKIICGGMGGAEFLAKGLLYAADQKADVANMSLQFYSYSSLVVEAVNYAHERGLLMIAAAGNGHSENVAYPARYDHVYAVSATDQGDGLAYFSNYGEQTDISAPGQAIISTYQPGDSYEYLSGTSMATPMIVAGAAQLFRYYGYEQDDAIMEHLASSSMDLGEPGWDKKFGYGRLDMYFALRTAIYCPQDLNRDGKLNKMDLDLFIELGRQRNRVVDFNMDRKVNKLDFIEFIKLMNREHC